MKESKAIHPVRTWRTSSHAKNPAPVTSELAMLVATQKHYESWCLPTEVVVMKPQFVTPKIARYWEVWASDVRNLMGWNEVQWPNMLETRSYHEIEGKPRVTKYSKANFAYLIEDHDDCGDDGHTHYELVRYHLLTPGAFESYLKFRYESNEQGWKYAGEQYHILPCDEYCESCKQWSVKETWHPDLASRRAGRL